MLERAQNKNQKQPDMEHNVLFQVPNKHKPSSVPSTKCNNSIWGSFVQLIA